MTWAWILLFGILNKVSGEFSNKGFRRVTQSNFSGIRSHPSWITLVGSVSLFSRKGLFALIIFWV